MRCYQIANAWKKNRDTCGYIPNETHVNNTRRFEKKSWCIDPFSPSKVVPFRCFFSFCTSFLSFSHSLPLGFFRSVSTKSIRNCVGEWCCGSKERGVLLWLKCLLTDSAPHVHSRNEQVHSLIVFSFFVAREEVFLPVDCLNPNCLSFVSSDRWWRFCDVSGPCDFESDVDRSTNIF